jgi:hypothetical protein
LTTGEARAQSYNCESQRETAFGNVAVGQNLLPWQRCGKTDSARVSRHVRRTEKLQKTFSELSCEKVDFF